MVAVDEDLNGQISRLLYPPLHEAMQVFAMLSFAFLAATETCDETSSAFKYIGTRITQFLISSCLPVFPRWSYDLF